jgi:tetratricopeptide (TPR) repeat protein
VLYRRPIQPVAETDPEEESTMSIRRPIMLVLGTALALFLGLHYGQELYPQLEAGLHPMPAEPKPLNGKNSITNLAVRQTRPGVWTADFDYFYTGEPAWAGMRIDLGGASGSSNGTVGPENLQTSLPRPERGAHHVSHKINYPRAQIETQRVTAKLLREISQDHVIVSQEVTQLIDWPDFGTWIRNQQLALGTPDDSLKTAIAMIDTENESQIAEAKSILEQLITQNPRFDAAYVELARVAMKQNWSPEGLHQAEGLLGSALQIRPDSANAKILLGYVYAHQKRFPQAEALFADAEKSNPPNLWLWANWGDLYSMLGKTDQAMAKYREAIAHPMTHDTYDRARNQAYVRLLALLDQRKDYDGMEALYKQRVAEFGPGACYTVDYAKFKLQVRGDAQGAIDLARGALNQNCEDSGARRVLGMANYVAWASAESPRQSEALNEARVFLPPGPLALYMLATGERSLPALKKLLRSGEKIDERDSENMTALAYALQDGDLSAARRLLALGAQPDLPVGPAGMPVALVPVIEGNVDGIRLMQHSGVDYSKLRFHGASALEFARRSGNKELINVIIAKGTTL